MMNNPMNCDVQQLAAPGVRDLHPYLPGKPISELQREYGVSDIIKLASNENPLGPSPVALSVMRENLETLALYPDGGGFDLRAALADRHGVSAERITLGNGSNDVLVLLAEAFLTAQHEAVYSQYCFAVYPIAVQATGATARVAAAVDCGEATDSRQAMGHDLDAMAALVNDKTRLVFIANPNNPTGTWLQQAELRAFIESMPANVLVVLDEAYFEYAAQLGVPDTSTWLDDYPNLVVTRTFSKAFGLAGIRVGYALSSAPVADLLNRVRQPFNVNSLALLAAEAALADTQYLQQVVSLNAEGIEQLSAGMQALSYKVTPSAGNFLLVDMGRPAMPIYEGLLRQGLIVRPVGNYGLPDHLRITIGTKGQNEALLGALENV